MVSLCLESKWSVNKSLKYLEIMEWPFRSKMFFYFVIVGRLWSSSYHRWRRSQIVQFYSCSFPHWHVLHIMSITSRKKLYEILNSPNSRSRLNLIIYLIIIHKISYYSGNGTHKPSEFCTEIFMTFCWFHRNLKPFARPIFLILAFSFFNVYYLHWLN